MKDQRGDHNFHHQTMNSFPATTVTPSPAIHILPSPMDEHPDFEQDPNESRNAKWYYSAFHNSAAMVGAGVLTLPYAMSELGWGPGVAMLILAWVITLYTLWQMIEMHEMFRGRRFDRYHELGQAAFGKELGLYIIVPQQFLVQLSVCIIYMVTGGLSLQKIYHILCHNCKGISIRHFILIFASSEFLLSQLKNFNSLLGVSLVATVMSVGYSTMAWVASATRGVQSDVHYSYSNRTYGVTYDFFSGLGKMAFAYAGHNVVLEIQATIPSTPGKTSTRPMWKGAIVAYIVVAFCYFPVAIAGYRVFGNNVCEVVLQSFIEHVPKELVVVANMLVVIHLIGAYQVYSMPAFDLIESLMTKRWHFPPTRTLRCILRSTFVAFTMGVALALPYFGALLGFLGGFVFVPTSYFIPCIIWLILKRPRRFSLSWWTNWVCIVAGVLLMILAPIGGLAQLIYQIRSGLLMSEECQKTEKFKNK